MIEGRTQIEIKKGDRSYRLNIAPDSPLGELYDVVSEMRGIIYNKIKEVEEIVKVQQEQQIDPVETPKE